MKRYQITLRHDGGTVTVRVSALNCHAAIQIVCQAENAPVSAVLSWIEI